MANRFFQIFPPWTKWHLPGGQVTRTRQRISPSFSSLQKNHRKLSQRKNGDSEKWGGRVRKNRIKRSKRRPPSPENISTFLSSGKGIFQKLDTLTCYWPDVDVSHFFTNKYFPLNPQKWHFIFISSKEWPATGDSHRCPPTETRNHSINLEHLKTRPNVS